MNKYALAFALLCGFIQSTEAKPIHYGVTHPHWKRGFAPVVSRLRAVDGDTFEYVTRPERQEKRRFRLFGIDTPELEIACEKKQAQDAKAALASILKNRVIVYAARERDRYGRELARVTLGKKDVASLLISQNLGRPYDGGKRLPWCDASNV
jgi:micrococcal nuclease